MKKITVRIHDGTGTLYSAFSFNGGSQIRIPNIVQGICERTIRTVDAALLYLREQFPDSVRSEVRVQISDLEAFGQVERIQISELREVPEWMEKAEATILSFENLTPEYSPPVDG